MFDRDLLKKVLEMKLEYDDIDDDQLKDDIRLLKNAKRNVNTLLRSHQVKKLQLEFGEQEDDIYIVSFSKSGTTLTQMIMHLMLTNGDVDFEHIYDVAPWLQYFATEEEPMKELKGRRLIKSHDDYEVIRHVKKGKFIFLIRDCLDVLPSFYQHLNDYKINKSPWDVFCKYWMKGWFFYHRGWLENKNELDILFVHYEELVTNKKDVVGRMAEFVDHDLTDEEMGHIMKKSSIEFMKKHEKKFGLQPDKGMVYDNFIRNGIVGAGKPMFSAEQLDKWREMANVFMADHPVSRRYFEKEN